MVARVTDTKVRAIRPSNNISDYSPYIDAANAIVDDINSKCGKSFSEDRLTKIELWLSAHYASAYDPLVARTRFEQYEATYQVGNRQLSGVMSDKFGQIANKLAEGCLVEFEKRKITMKSVGATYSDE